MPLNIPPDFDASVHGFAAAGPRCAGTVPPQVPLPPRASDWPSRSIIFGIQLWIDEPDHAAVIMPTGTDVFEARRSRAANQHAADGKSAPMPLAVDFESVAGADAAQMYGALLGQSVAGALDAVSRTLNMRRSG